jgi:hypothetical protein
MPTWDDRIDEAAQRLTEGEPASGFRARLLSRLEEARPARAWTHGWIFAPVAAATVALALAAIVQLRQPDRAAPPPAIEQQSAATASTTSGGGPSGPPYQAAEIGGPKGPPYASADIGGPDGPPYQINVDDFAPPELVVDALDIPPASIAPLRVEALEELQVPASDTIEIAPLDSGHSQ